MVNRTLSKRSIAVIQLLLTGFFWSLGGILIKMVDLNPFVISSIRSLIASFVLLIFLKGRPRFVFDLPQILGAVFYVGTVSFFVSANKETTSANAILLQYVAPVYVAVYGFIFLKEKLKWFDAAAIMGIAVGMIVFFSEGVSGGGMFGNILAVISGVCFAGQTICMKMHKNGSQVETLLLGNLAAFVIGLPFIFKSHQTMSHIWVLLVLGIFQLGIPYILYPLASRYATALDLILIPMVEPLLNPVWVFFGTGEIPAKTTVIGGLIVLSMVVMKSIFAVKTFKEPSCYDT